MTEAEFNQIREVAWRRPLTAREQADARAWIAAHPEMADELALDLALAQAVHRIPDTPVSSNFTARVMESIDREAVDLERAGFWEKLMGDYRVWLPRLAGVMGVIILGLGIWAWNGRVERAKITSVLTQVAQLTPSKDSFQTEFQSPNVWKDFDTIRRLNEILPDNDLLTILK